MPGDEIQPACPALNIPLGSEMVPAGFPSPAQDHVEQCLDLNEYLIGNPAATFFLTVGSVRTWFLLVYVLINQQSGK